MIRDFIEKLGFSQNEVTVYLTLVQLGRATGSQLAASTKLNRTTVYGVLATLIKKGLTVEDLGAATSLYLPTPPSSLIEFFERRENEARKQKELATRVANEVSRMSGNQSVQLAKITFVDEPDIENYLTNRTFRWCSSLQAYDHVWRGFQDSRLLKEYSGYFSELYKTLLPETVSQELITEDFPVEMDFQKENPQPRRKVKIWKHGFDFTYSTWVIGDYVVMIQSKGHPFYLIEIKDPALAKNLRELFSGIWKFIP